MKVTTHLYLVSAQATPNITPALDNAIRPEHVVLLVSKDMQENADWLEAILKQAAGIKVSRWQIDHPWDIEQVQNRVLELLGQGQYAQPGSIALNATGGTKPMSIAAYEAFRAFGHPIFYVHPEKDQLIWMYPPDQARHLLADRITIPHFLQAHGSRVTARAPVSVPPAYRELAEDLVTGINYFSEALGVLNYFASTARNSLRSERLEGKSIRGDAFQDLCERLEAINVLKASSERLVFYNEEARFFANGGWLEQYVYASLNSLKKEIPQIQDTAMGLEVERGKSVRNEIDVALLVENKLHLIECKAKQFTKPEQGGAAEVLYKLDSITSGLGGIQARSMLVSYRPVPKSELKRAEELRVEVVQEKQLSELKSRLQQWITKSIRE